MRNGKSWFRRGYPLVAAAIAVVGLCVSDPGRGAWVRLPGIADAWAAGLRASPTQPTGEGAKLKTALDAVRRCDIGLARQAQAGLADPLAQKIVDWALVGVVADQLPVAELNAAVVRLGDWPGEDARRGAQERAQQGRRQTPTACGGVPREDEAAMAFRQQKIQMYAALRRGDPRGAYAAIAEHGQAGSLEYAESEALAGWLALDKLHDPARAKMHFERLDAAVSSPVSKARAAYWRGRVAERMGDTAQAQTFYEQGAAYSTTFYGQLAAEKAGRQELVLTPDPRPDADDRASFEGSEMARAIRLLAASGERGLLRGFALGYGDAVKTPVELALLVDELRGLDERELSLLAYRRGARRGLLLYDRGYPVVRTPSVSAGPERAWVLAIMRQESQFDPRVRSPAGAQGMMQILPETGRRVARETGMPWSDDLLFDADANMRLGSRYLGDLTQAFGGSYILAAAGYNAGPLRPPEWIAFCGDPRSPATDPVDFIQCIPQTETRDYVMNVLANYQVYRARLNDGQARLTAVETLRRVRRP